MITKTRRPSITLVNNIVAGMDTSSDTWWDTKVARHESGTGWVLYVEDPVGTPIEVLVPDDRSAPCERLDPYHILSHRQAYILRRFIAAEAGR